MRDVDVAVIGHVGGSVARDLMRGDSLNMEAFFRERLTMAFGADFTREIDSAASTNWQNNSLIRGAYSAALPGQAQKRRDAIAAHTGRVVFAGEAFSLHAQGTAHGAYQSGQDAVERLAAGLLEGVDR